MHIMTQNFKTLAIVKLAQVIHTERVNRGMTLQKLGESCGVHHSQLSRIERGKVVRMSKNVEKICKFLQISLDSSPCPSSQELMIRVERLILSSQSSARAIESLVAALEELTEG